MNVGPSALLAHFQTNARAVELRHHPVKQCQSRSIRQRQFLQSHSAIVDRNHFISFALECFLKQSAGYCFIVCNKNLHTFFSSAYAFNSGNNVATSHSRSVKASVSPDFSPALAMRAIREAIVAARVIESQESMPFKA